MMPADVVEWLLEPENPSARFLTLTNLLHRSADHPEVAAARAAIPNWGPVKAILDAQWPQGYWMQPGRGYSPRHKATVWQVVFLGALGAPLTEAIRRACNYVLEHSRLADARFSAHNTGTGAILCLNGNLLRALQQLGYQDSRTVESLEALAQMVSSDGFRCHFHTRAIDRSSAPARRRDRNPCARGAIKALGAFALTPPQSRSPVVKDAVEAGVAFLLGGDPLSGDSSTPICPGPLTNRLGFPLDCTADPLEALEVLASLGLRDPAVCPWSGSALDLVRQKQDGRGCWALEYTPRNTWSRFGRLGEPNKWVTLRALGALQKWQCIT